MRQIKNGSRLELALLCVSYWLPCTYFPAAEQKLTPDDAADLVRELLPARISSRELGLKLGLSKPVVEHIHHTFSEPQDRLFHVLIESTSASGSTRPTWKALGEALRSPEVDVPDLADEIESAFTTSKPDLSAGAYACIFVIAFAFIIHLYSSREIA